MPSTLSTFGFFHMFDNAEQNSIAPNNSKNIKIIFFCQVFFYGLFFMALHPKKDIEI